MLRVVLTLLFYFDEFFGGCVKVSDCCWVLKVYLMAQFTSFIHRVIYVDNLPAEQHANSGFRDV